MTKLKIAIITDKNNYLSWHNAIINDLLKAEYIELVFNIDSNKIINSVDNINQTNPLLWKLFFKIDAHFFKPKPDALAHSENYSQLESITSSNTNNNSDLKELNDYNLDVIINFTEASPPNTLKKAAKFGVWFFNHCNIETLSKRPNGIWEMINNSPEVVGVLRYIKDDMPFPKTIDKTSSCTDGLSFKRNYNDILWQTHLLLSSNLELLAKNEELFNKKLTANTNIFKDKPLNVPFSPPSNLRALQFGVSLYYKKLVQLIKSKFYFDQWALIFYHNENNKNPYNLKNYTQILPPKDRFWADPFLIKHNGKTYLFIEELIYKNKLGHLAVMEIDENGNYTKPITIMVKDYHLSYPFVFEDNGEFYMIPETSGNNDIQLYKATDFPLKWEFQQVIMEDVVAVDTTIYKESGTYWMFTNIKKHEGTSKHVELFLFSSKELITNQWVAHPLNPIIKDIKTSRPAGNLFKSNNKLYRPSQNCSYHYGYALNISEIKKISNNEYNEEVITEVKPNWDKMVKSTHSFNSVGNLFISDIKIKRSRF